MTPLFVQISKTRNPPLILGGGGGREETMSPKNLFTNLNTDSLGLSHAKVDTVFFTIYNKIRESLWRKTVVIHAEDTDIYVQVAYLWGTSYQEKEKYVGTWTLFITAIPDVVI